MQGIGVRSEKEWIDGVMESWSHGNKVMEGWGRTKISGVPDKSGFPPHGSGGQVRSAPTGFGCQE